MEIMCIIPSRIGSTRLMRKALLPIQGKPMIQWVYENASRCQLLAAVIVATDSEEIAEVIIKCGGKVVMTDPDLATGSDRVAAAAAQYPQMDIIINLQGDEPFIKPLMLEQLVAPYVVGESPEMTTLAYPLNHEDLMNPGAVKVITDINMNAIYFSRTAIPYGASCDQLALFHHMGVYAFRRDFLMTYTSLQQTPLEKAERLEQLRVLEHGYQIRVCPISDRTLEINTIEEFEAAQHFKYCE